MDHFDKIVAAAEMVTALPGRPRINESEDDDVDCTPKITMQQAADHHGVSYREVVRMRRLLALGIPELFHAVKNKEINLGDTDQMVVMPPAKQLRTLRAVKKMSPVREGIEEIFHQLMKK